MREKKNLAVGKPEGSDLEIEDEDVVRSMDLNSLGIVAMFTVNRTGLREELIKQNSTNSNISELRASDEIFVESNSSLQEDKEVDLIYPDDRNNNDTESSGLSPSKMQALKGSIERPSKPSYLRGVIPLLLMIAFLVFQNLFRGNENLSSLTHVEPCSAVFWAILGIYAIFGLCVFALSLCMAKRDTRVNFARGYEVNYDWS